jgi:hypothetical protein
MWKSSTYRVLVGNSEREKLLIKLRRRWENNIKTGPKEMGWEVVDRDSFEECRLLGCGAV